MKCDSTFIGVNLTVGKEYEVIDSIGVYHVVKDDEGIEKKFPRSYFEKVEIKQEKESGNDEENRT